MLSTLKLCRRRWSRIKQYPRFGHSASSVPDSMHRDYPAAIAALNTLQSNFSIVDAIRKSGRGLNKDAIPEMIEWCRRIGYEPSEFNRLNIIHVAGTKGKGSTSTFISSILCRYLSPQNYHTSKDEPQSSRTSSTVRPPTKIGLYTSPHLRSVRERIQINSEPLSELVFARYFFEVWDRLEASAAKLGVEVTSKPVYFRYLTLMAFHAYLSEGVDTAVIECGIGGEYDSTNVIEKPVVSAVTSLGIDHTAMLGDTLKDIAWHKAGIFKNGTVTNQAFTVASQQPMAMEVLLSRAKDKGLQLIPVPIHPSLEDGNVKLGLAADFQRTNASLAIAVTTAHLKALGVAGIPESASNVPLPEPFKQGLETAHIGGRCETRRQGNVTWLLDGGHTLESIRLVAEWYATCITSSTVNSKNPSSMKKRVLIFNQQTRDATALATGLHAALSQALVRPTTDDSEAAQLNQAPLFTHAFFCTNVTFASPPAAVPSSTPKHDSESSNGINTIGRYKPDLVSINNSANLISMLAVQKELAQTWGCLRGEARADVRVFGTIEEAVRAVRDVAAADEDEEEVTVLVTGSLHLVGGVLEVLETIDPAQTARTQT